LADRDSVDLRQAVDELKCRSADNQAIEPDQLIEEIGLVVRKMASDLDHVRALPKTPQSVSQASKMALLHTRQYLTSLNDYRMEINELVQQRRQEKLESAQNARKHMQTLSSVESQLAKLYQDIKSISVPQDQQTAFKTLSVLSRLPSVYGQLLVESVRRREWAAKMKHDTSALQEEVATYQEEEEKRRKKWARIVDDVVNADALQDRVPGIELNIQNEDGSWPDVSRQELQDHLRNILEVYGSGQITSEIDQAIKDLDKPTRQQIKHAKAFKQGSMHEAAFGNASLLLRGDEQHRALRDQNLLLEQEVKAHKSRVVKLESLLYRANQASRTSTGEIFTPLTDGSISGRSPIGQMSEDFSRNSSLKPRRQSFAQGIEEKKLAKRVVDLEAELQSFKDDAHTRKASDAETQKQVEDALSTKRDLMQNMEAQQREFANERRGLEKELAEAKDRIEEIENEMERMIGSRDGFDYEIARLKDDAAGHAARAATEFDARRSLELKLTRAEAAQKQAEQDALELRQEQARQQAINAEHRSLLTTAWAHLSPGNDAPVEFAEMAAALEDLARRSAAQAKDLEEAVSFAKAENESLWASNERQKTELAGNAQKQTETEAKVRAAEDRASAEEARAGALEEQLRAEQEQLRISRSRFAEGETGSEALRQRLTEEEARANSVSVELAELRSHNGSLEAELTRLQSQQLSLQTAADATTELLDGRRERAKEISQRLFSQNARLIRLLDRLGLVISYQGNAMVIERASKMGASTANMLDASNMQLTRVASLTSPPGTRKPSTTDPEAMSELRLIQWMNASTSDDEKAQFEAFLTHVAKFDLDVFADAITKRVKDFEYTAKKYNKEAKESTKRAEGYKERFLKSRNEAHSKIAVRDFKEGDLALFLPTRGGQVKGAWAAFNIGCPHFFLAERDGMRLGTRDFIVARIQKVEQKIVDLGRTSSLATTPAAEFGSEGPSSMLVEDDNPFDLSDGLAWWMVHAVEERGAGAAPTTPGLGKSTVAVSGLDAKGSIRIKRSPKSDDASKHLNKSLESRRSSSASKKSAQAMPPPASPKAAPTIAVDTGFRQQRPESQHSSSLPRQGVLASSPLGIEVVNNADASNFPPHPQQVVPTAQHHPLLQHTQPQYHSQQQQHHYQQSLQPQIPSQVSRVLSDRTPNKSSP
jgi:autophagy-related protein 11